VSPRKAARRLAEKHGLTARRTLQAQNEPDQSRLAAAVWAGDGDELALLDAQVDLAKHGRAVSVRERDVAKLDRRR
jgi:hypothetical protein